MSTFYAGNWGIIMTWNRRDYAPSVDVSFRKRLSTFIDIRGGSTAFTPSVRNVVERGLTLTNGRFPLNVEGRGTQHGASGIAGRRWCTIAAATSHPARAAVSSSMSFSPLITSMAEGINTEKHWLGVRPSVVIRGSTTYCGVTDIPKDSVFSVTTAIKLRLAARFAHTSANNRWQPAKIEL